MTDRLAFPFEIGTLGTPRTTSGDDLARQQLEQLLFTIQGERANRPTFGCGVQQLVFSTTSREACAAAEYLISNNIRQHLPDIALDAVRVTPQDETLHIDILYTLRATGEERAASFATGGGNP